MVVCDYAGGCQSEGAGGQLGRVGVCVCLSRASGLAESVLLVLSMGGTSVKGV